MSVSGEPIKIGVVGDGPIGNLVVAKLLIEHGRNSNRNNNIEITHFTSKRVKKSGYSRRHVLFITEELVAELEQNVLDCNNCLKDIANNQILTEDSIDGKKLLFSTRLLEQILLNHIKDKSQNSCSSGHCIFKIIVEPDNPNYNEFHYVFFAIGSNAAKIRTQYFHSESDFHYNIKCSNVKIIAPHANPIVAFYSDLGTPDNNITDAEMIEDKNSKIQLITMDELNENNINIYDLEKFVTIIYNFYDKIEIFLDRYIYRNSEKTDHSKIFEEDGNNDKLIFRNLPELIQNELRTSMFLITKLNISLYGYDNYNSFINKFANAIYILQKLFNQTTNNEVIRLELFNAYIEFLKSEQMRPPTNDESIIWYEKIINNDESIITLLNNYIKLIYKYLKNIEEIKKQEKEACVLESDICATGAHKDEDTNAVCAIKLQLPKEYAANYKCLNIKFLVNIVQQSLDCFGICNDKLAYAAKKGTTNFFMIGDMANAYPAGISVEIGINFVNYIIPMFYNFYINEIKTINKCSELNIVDILDDLLSEKYNNLLKYNTNVKSTVQSTVKSVSLNLKSVISIIRNYYNDNLSVSAEKLCVDDDIFLTYYNIVLLIQFIKNVDLILNEKKIIAISKIFKPSNYKIINNDVPEQGLHEKGLLEQFPAKVGGRKSSKRSSKLKF